MPPGPFDFDEPHERPRRRRRHTPEEAGPSLGFTPMQIVGGLISLAGGLGLLVFGLLYVQAVTEVVPAEQLPRRQNLADWLGLLLVASGFVCGIGGTVAYVFGSSEDLAQRVASLGQIRGAKQSVVVSTLGPPNVTEHGEQSVCTWNSPRYSVTLAFRDGRCLGVVREVNL